MAKNDIDELTELGQFLRDAFPKILVRVEWAMFYDDENMYRGYSKVVYEDSKYNFRIPDFMLIDKESKKLLGCIEIDGSIHDVHVDDTDKRNKLYDDLNINLKVINKTLLKIEKTSIFDIIYRYAEEICKEE